MTGWFKRALMSADFDVRVLTVIDERALLVALVRVQFNAEGAEFLAKAAKSL